VFSNALGNPIEPKAFTRHWCARLRVLSIRQRGLYYTRDTFVTTALQKGVKIAWLETQRHARRGIEPQASHEKLEGFRKPDPQRTAIHPHRMCPSGHIHVGVAPEVAGGRPRSA
jgi:hypothetical protein